MLIAKGCDYSPITYNNISGVSKDSMAIYVRGGQLGVRRILATGEYVRRKDLVQLLWQIESTKEKILKADQFGVMIDEYMPTVFNKSITLNRNTYRVGYDANNNLIYDPLPELGPNDPPYDDPLVANAVVTITRIDPQIGALNTGRSPQGLTRYSDELKVEYCVNKAQ